ncbi:MAG: amidohydrolase family protein [Actinomycetales bacterium]|nr:amidohydrolase family protein [Actinomycetales bacterium]
MTPSAVRIEADLLVPGRGAPVTDGVVVLDGARIAYAGPAADAPPHDGPVTRVPTVMPGLWDTHAHFMGVRDLDLGKLLTEPHSVSVARAVRSAADVIQAGFTSVRELGGHGVFLARAIDEGTLTGPTIYAAGSILSPTGGHADFHGHSLATVMDYSAHEGATQLCDGVPDCLKAVRLQLRKNARVIKICASGGVLSEVDHPIHQQFSGEELRAIVEEAGRAERVVAAHCHGKPGIMAALEAGCRTIEHGTYLDEEAATAMREAGAILVSTRAIVARMTLMVDKVPPFAATKIRAIVDRHAESMHVAREAGVTIAAGTDFATVGPGTLVPLGLDGEELGHLVDVGYTPLEAIEAATASAPATLGPQAPRSGRLVAGYDADVIAVDGDPTLDVTILANPDRVTHVWKAGSPVKAPAA